MKNTLQNEYQKHFDMLKTAEINEQLWKEVIDITLPGTEIDLWHFSLLT
jgi:hypothetical protein